MCIILANMAATELFKAVNDYISGKLNWSFWIGLRLKRLRLNLSKDVPIRIFGADHRSPKTVSAYPDIADHRS